MAAWITLVLCLPAAKPEIVHCSTTRGPLEITVHKEWAPAGHARFLKLVNDRFFDDQLIYNAQRGFMFQFGLASSAEKQHEWLDSKIEDDPDVSFCPHTTT